MAEKTRSVISVAFFRSSWGCIWARDTRSGEGVGRASGLARIVGHRSVPSSLLHVICCKNVWYRFEIPGGAFCPRLVGPGVSFHCVFVFVKLIVLVSLFVGWLYLLRCVVTGYRGGVTSLLPFHRQISGVVGSRRGNMCCSST